MSDDPLKDRLGNTNGGRILDVATGRGDSAKYLTELFAGYDELVGVDISEKNLAQAREKIAGDAVRFETMSADRLTFADTSFDTVAISNSLHHLADPEKSLAEMHRVLKPNGMLIVSEMIRDNLTERQKSHMLMHHWWAEIDRLEGVPHFETFTRQQILDMVNARPFGRVETFEFGSDGTELADPETVNYLHSAYEMYIERARKHPEKPHLAETGEKLWARINEIGINWATGLCVLGWK